MAVFCFQISQFFLAVYYGICVYNAFMPIIVYDGDDTVYVSLYPHLRHYSILHFAGRRWA